MRDRLQLSVYPDCGRFSLENLEKPHDAPAAFEAEDFHRRFRAAGIAASPGRPFRVCPPSFPAATPP